jgi:acetylornithine/succinyldiaminopimelate/putrescine aminotransferase
MIGLNSVCVLVAGWLLVQSCAFKQPSRITLPNSASKDEGRLPALRDTVADYSQNVMNTYGRYPMTISRGSGCKLYDVEGKEYLDFASGIATCCLGHAHPALKKAVCEQMDRVHHCSNLYFIPEQAALAKWLVDNSCADKVTSLK